MKKGSTRKDDVVMITSDDHYKNCLAVVKTTYEFGGVEAYIYQPGSCVEIVRLKPGQFVNLNKRMPRQKPGKSIQTYGTPMEFIHVVKDRFQIDNFSCDLAAVSATAKAPRFLTPEQDSLKTDWTPYLSREIPSWLNPPFNKISPWAERCAKYGQQGYKILFLTPLTSANWCVQWVKPYAKILGLNPRLTFEGEEQNYPKDLQLACYGFNRTGFEFWEWKKVG